MVAPWRGGPIPGSTRTFSLPPAGHSRGRGEDARLEAASSSRTKGWENWARWHLPENRGLEQRLVRPLTHRMHRGTYVIQNAHDSRRVLMGSRKQSSNSLTVLKQQKRILAQLWRPEVCSRGVSRVRRSLEAPEETLFFASSSFWGLLTPISAPLSASLPPLCVFPLYVKVKSPSAFLLQGHCDGIQSPPG